MKSIFPKIMIFGLSFLMFGIVALQIFLGYVQTGRTGHQQRIYMLDEPVKFWAIAAMPIIIGAIAFIWGIVSILRRK